jgi:hypothetical protein
MKKVAILLIGAFFVVAMAGAGLAQEKTKPEKPSAAAQAKESKKGAAKKDASLQQGEYRMGGIVTKIDPAGQKITIQQNKAKGERIATLKIDKSLSQAMANIKQGDVVDVWIQGMNIKSFNKVE